MFEIFLNGPIKVSNGHIFPPEFQGTPRPAAIGPYFTLLTPSSYRAGVYIENTGDIIRG